MKDQDLVALKTKDPLLTIAIETDTAWLDLTSTQPRLHKRLTKRLKAKQEAYLYGEMLKLGFSRLDA